MAELIAELLAFPGAADAELPLIRQDEPERVEAHSFELCHQITLSSI